MLMSSHIRRDGRTMKYFFAEAGSEQKFTDWLESKEALEALTNAVKQVRLAEADLKKAREVSREELALPVTV